MSGVDQFVWLARLHGYDAFLKVPCRARHAEVASIEFGEYSHAAWLAPLSSGTSYLPSRFTAQKYLIQDLLLIDRQHAGLAEKLKTLAARDCAEGTSFQLFDDLKQERMGLHKDGFWVKPEETRMPLRSTPRHTMRSTVKGGKQRDVQGPPLGTRAAPSEKDLAVFT